MTREEAINKLNWALDNNTIEDVQSAYEYIMAINMAIEALEQEPILDKIRAEIDEHIEFNKKMNYMGIVGGLLLAKDVLDKYKAESEKK